MARNPRLPSYRRHSSGQARVTLNGNDHLLGPYGSPESKEAYNRLLREYLEGVHQPSERRGEEKEPLSLNEVILAYWKHAKDYYGFDGKRGDEACLRDALRVVKDLYGLTSAQEFGPKALKLCRSEMIAKGWSRNYVNAQTGRIKRMFRWATEEEMIPPAVFHGLQAVKGLRRGKTEARETRKVKPVSQEHIDATLPYLPKVVRDMVKLQLLSGCRPDKVCRLRPMDLDTSDPACWVYRPGTARGTQDRSPRSR
jgi:integrase